LTPQLLISPPLPVNTSASVNPPLPTAGQGTLAPVLIATLAPPSNAPFPVVALISLPASIATVPGGGGAPRPGTTPGAGPGTPTAALALTTGPGWLIEPMSETELATNLVRTGSRRAGWTNDPSLEVGLNETGNERDPWPGVWGNGLA